MKKRIFALILALAMALSLLTGCNSGSAAADSSAAASVDPADEANQAILEAAAGAIPEEAKSDIVSYLTDGALKANSVVMKAGDIDITAGYYLFWLGRELNNMNMFYQQYGQTLDLGSEFSEGKTVAQYLQTSAEQMVRTYTAIEVQSKEKGVKLSEAQEKQLEEYVSSLEPTAVSYYGTTLEDQRTTYAQNLLHDALNDYLKENGELAVTEDGMADYVKEKGYYNCRYILFQVEENADESTDDKEQKKKAADSDKEQKKKAQAAYDELSKLEGDAQLEKFKEYQKENPDGNTNEFGFDATTSIDEGFRAKVQSLKEGELGMTDKTSFGYFVLLRLPVDTSSLEQTYLEERFNTMLTEWTDALDLQETEEMKKLDVTAVCTKLLALQDDMNKAAAAVSAAADASASGAAAEEIVVADESAAGSAAGEQAEASAASSAS